MKLSYSDKLIIGARYRYEDGDCWCILEVIEFNLNYKIKIIYEPKHTWGIKVWDHWRHIYGNWTLLKNQDKVI